MERQIESSSPIRNTSMLPEREYFEYGLFGSFLMFIQWMLSVLLLYRAQFSPSENMVFIQVFGALSTTLAIVTNLLMSNAFKGFNAPYATKASQGFLLMVVAEILSIAISIINPNIGLFIINAGRIFVWALAGLTLWDEAVQSPKPHFFEFAAIVIALSGVLKFITNTIPLMLENRLYYSILFNILLYNNIGDSIFVAFVFFLVFWLVYRENRNTKNQALNYQ